MASPEWFTQGGRAPAVLLEPLPRPVSRAHAISPEGSIRLPRSAERRQTITYVKLLDSVRPDASGGFRFEGRTLRPGATLDRAKLPNPAVLLECAGNSGPGTGHNRREYLYVLWRYDRSMHDWRDIAQARSVDREWMLALGPAAMRALDPRAAGRAAMDYGGIADRVFSLLEAELSEAPVEASRAVLALLGKRIDARLALAS